MCYAKSRVKWTPGSMGRGCGWKAQVMLARAIMPISVLRTLTVLST